MRDGDSGEGCEDESENIALTHCFVDMEPSFVLFVALKMVEHIVGLGHQEVVDHGDGDGDGEEDGCAVIPVGNSEDTALDDKEGDHQTEDQALEVEIPALYHQIIVHFDQIRGDVLPETIVLLFGDGHCGEGST